MTTKELIDALNELDAPDADVWVEHVQFQNIVVSPLGPGDEIRKSGTRNEVWIRMYGFDRKKP